MENQSEQTKNSDINVVFDRQMRIEGWDQATLSKQVKIKPPKSSKT